MSLDRGREFELERTGMKGGRTHQIQLKGMGIERERRENRLDLLATVQTLRQRKTQRLCLRTCILVGWKTSSAGLVVQKPVGKISTPITFQPSTFWNLHKLTRVNMMKRKRTSSTPDSTTLPRMLTVTENERRRTISLPIELAQTVGVLKNMFESVTP